METELGQQLKGDERCSTCRARDQEYWVYSKKGAQQVSRPGDTCARCCVTAQSGGCSWSTQKRPPNCRRLPLPPGPGSIGANKPPGGPPPGPSGGGVTV